MSPLMSYKSAFVREKEKEMTGSSGEKLIFGCLKLYLYLLALATGIIIGCAVFLSRFIAGLISDNFTAIRLWCENRRLEAHNRLLTLEGLDVMSGREFEQYLIGLWRHQGYTVSHIGQAGDQGCDLLLKRHGIRTICQAKCYRTFVANGAVQQAVAAKAYYRATESMVITNSYFTKGARALASANGCRLIDRDELAVMISRYRKPAQSTFLERTYEKYFMKQDSSTPPLPRIVERD